MEKVFCTECLCDETYYVTEKKVKENVDGKEITYLVKSAFCENCHTELYVDEIMNFNIISYQDAIREVSDIIKISEIKTLLEKYNIGAKPLAKLLKWGEISIIRYLKGSIPERMYSDKLKELLYDEKKMEILLYTNKDFISDTAYRKCKGALKKIQLRNENSKLYMTANLITGINPDITHLALQKLLYFVQGFSSVMLNQPIFYDTPEAWGLGPVYRDIYHRYASYQYHPIEFDIEEFNIDNITFTAEEIDIITTVVTLFGEYSGSKLAEMTHSTEPWKKHPVNSNEQISLEEMEEYFDKVVKKYSITVNNKDSMKKYITDIKK